MLITNILMLSLLLSNPVKVNNINADACFKKISVSWDKSRGAKGYRIYISDENGNEQIREIEGKENCEYSIENYVHDCEYTISISAINKEKESELSKGLTVKYISKEHAQKIPVLTYHNIGKTRNPDDSDLFIDEETFRNHMKYLKENGYKTATMDEFYAWHSGELELPTKTCVVTFDDGDYGTYYVAYPIIKELGLSATVFCIGRTIKDTTEPYNPNVKFGSYVGKDSIDEVRSEYPNFAFESHTYAMHKRVKKKIPATVYTYKQFMKDFEKNKKFGFRYMAYPWGVYNDTMIKAAKESGIKMGFAYRPYKYAERDDDSFIIGRIKISATIPMDEFISIVEGSAEEYDRE